MMLSVSKLTAAWFSCWCFIEPVCGWRIRCQTGEDWNHTPEHRSWYRKHLREDRSIEEIQHT